MDDFPIQATLSLLEQKKAEKGAPSPTPHQEGSLPWHLN